MSTADDVSTSDHAPLGEAEAAALFADLAALPALLLAVSGGPDSTALLILAARWRAALANGPRLIAATVDHGLRPDGAAEAAAVQKLAGALGLSHHTLRWTGQKPTAGLQEAARMARYGLLAQAARNAGAGHVLTAHTRDDQAETVLFRLARGSGLAGLAGMARVAPVPLSPPPGQRGYAPPGRSPSAARREGVIGEAELAASPHPDSLRLTTVPLQGRVKNCRNRPEEALLLVRPFLDIPKVRLVATLATAGIPFADDPSNRDSRFTRARLRTVLPSLAVEGLSAARLAQLAARMRRADAALEAAVERLAGDLGLGEAQLSTAASPRPVQLDAAAWVRAPAELRLRLLGRLIGRAGDEGAVELGKLEDLAAALAAAAGAGSGAAARFRRTLAGAMVTLSAGFLTVEPAPPRRSRRIVAPPVPTPTES